jgi:hypothetical protein
MHIFLAAFDHVPDPRAENARHDLGELLVIAFVSVLCGAASCAEMAAFGRAKESVFRDFPKLKHAIPSHDTFSAVLGMIDPKALDAAFGRVLADVAASAPLEREGPSWCPMVRTGGGRSTSPATRSRTTASSGCWPWSTTLHANP